MSLDSCRKRILDRLTRSVFDQKVIDNQYRGVWAEFMVADALGERCQVVSHGWHPWDLQIGDSKSEFPNRIRIQIKNTARIQTWRRPEDAPSKCQWELKMRKKPAYFERDNPGVSCEDYGYLCDLFVLCHHPLEDPDAVDHRDPSQWHFYLVPVTPDHSIFPVKPMREGQKSPSCYTVVPKSLRKGIRGRPPIKPLAFDQLRIDEIFRALALSRENSD